MLAFNSLLSLSLIWWIEVMNFFFLFFFFSWWWSKSRARMGVTGLEGVVGVSGGCGMKNLCGQRGYMVRIGSGSGL